MTDNRGNKFVDRRGMPRLRSFDRWLLEKLRDPEVAKAYLAEYFTDDGAGDSDELQLLALRNVAAARGYRLVPDREPGGE